MEVLGEVTKAKKAVPQQVWPLVGKFMNMLGTLGPGCGTLQRDAAHLTYRGTGIWKIEHCGRARKARPCSVSRD